MRPVSTADPPVVLAAMRLEALALGRGVVRTGMGHARARQAATRLAGTLTPGRTVVLAGISGGLAPTLCPGEMVVATEVCGPEDDAATSGPHPASSGDDATALAAELRRAGHGVHLGGIVSSRTLVHGERRAALAETGALAVDMESAWVAAALAGHRLVIVPRRGGHGRQRRPRARVGAAGAAPRAPGRRPLGRRGGAGLSAGTDSHRGGWPWRRRVLSPASG